MVSQSGSESMLGNQIEQALREILIDYEVQKTEKGVKIHTSFPVDIEYYGKYGKSVRIENGYDAALVLENSEDGVVVKRVTRDGDSEAETLVGKINGKITDVKFNATRIIDYGIEMETEIDIECKGSCGGSDD